MTSVGSTELARSAGAGFAGAGAEFSEVIPGDEDRGGDEPLGNDDDTTEGGTGSDDGGPGSENM